MEETSASEITSRTALLPPPPGDGEALEAQPDRRRHARLPLVVEVSIASEHNFYVGFSGDISEGGLFLATHMTQPIGSSILVGFTLPDEPEPILAAGVVCWVNPYREHCETPPGMGIRFVGLSEGAREAIAQFIEARQPLFWE